MQIESSKSWLFGDPIIDDLKSVDITKKNKWLDDLTPQKWRFFQ